MLFYMSVSLITKDKFLIAESWVEGHTLCKCFWYPMPNRPIRILDLFIHSLSSVWLLICMFQNEFLIFLRSCFMALVNLSVGFFLTKASANWIYCCWILFGALSSHNLSAAFLYCLNQPVLLLLEDSGRDSEMFTTGLPLCLGVTCMKISFLKYYFIFILVVARLVRQNTTYTYTWKLYSVLIFCFKYILELLDFYTWHLAYSFLKNKLEEFRDLFFLQWYRETFEKILLYLQSEAGMYSFEKKNLEF